MLCINWLFEKILVEKMCLQLNPLTMRYFRHTFCFGRILFISNGIVEQSGKHGKVVVISMTKLVNF